MKTIPIFCGWYSEPNLQLRLDYESTASLFERQFSDTHGQVGFLSEIKNRERYVQLNWHSVSQKWKECLALKTKVLCQDVL